MEGFGDLGSRSIDQAHDWESDGLDFTSKTIRDYQKLIEKTKPKWFSKGNKSSQQQAVFDWFPATKCQREALSLISKFLNKPKAEVAEKPLSLIVLGSPGTGKSVLINKVARLLNEQGRNYFIACPTGVAACNVSGVTLHSLLSIPFYKTDNYETLAFENAPSYKLQDRLGDLEFLIIDEVSMVGAAFLQLINIRLQTVKKEFEKPFGGVSVVLVGDLLQLPPVGDYVLYREPKTVTSFAAQGINLFRSFDHCILLDENVRVRDSEKDFKNLLFNIRRKKLSQQDYQLLAGRMECNLNPSEVYEFADSVRIFPKNAQVNAYNRKKIAQLDIPVVKIVAKQTPRHPQVFCEEPLLLGKNIRVMLTKNLDTSRNLVNGQLGTVEAVMWEKNKRPMKDLPSVIMVRFDNPDVGCQVENGCVPIPPTIEYQTDIYSGKSFKIEKFSLRVAFGMTVHKIQGLTLPKACVYLGHKEYFDNQTITSLSRVRKLSDLMILDPQLNRKRFEDWSFYRGLEATKREFARLGILETMMGFTYAGDEFSDISTEDHESSVSSMLGVSCDADAEDEYDETFQKNMEDVKTFREEWENEIDQKYLPLDELCASLDQTHSPQAPNENALAFIPGTSKNTLVENWLDNHPLDLDPQSYFDTAAETTSPPVSGEDHFLNYNLESPLDQLCVPVEDGDLVYNFDPDETFADLLSSLFDST